MSRPLKLKVTGTARFDGFPTPRSRVYKGSLRGRTADSFSLSPRLRSYADPSYYFSCIVLARVEQTRICRVFRQATEV
jgi:hypothetical protein